MTFAKQHGIGWNPRDEYFPSQRWGMSGGKIRIPKGLVITHRGENEILSIKIRCANTDQGPKYWQVRGSSDKCLILGTLGTPAVIVESELDAYLICQEVQGRIGVVSLGGTSKILDEDALTYLKQAPKVLIATDYDEPNLDAVGVGQKAFFKLREYFPMAEYLPPARGKDPCEMHAQGIPISLWLECASGATDSSKDLCLPPGYRGNVENLQKLLAQFPHLVPCPLTSPQWYWRYRTDCRTCEGHVHCLKDFPKAAESPPNTPGITVDMS
jgi:hypothetical protein